MFCSFIFILYYKIYYIVYIAFYLLDLHHIYIFFIYKVSILHDSIFLPDSSHSGKTCN